MFDLTFPTASSLIFYRMGMCLVDGGDGKSIYSDIRNLHPLYFCLRHRTPMSLHRKVLKYGRLGDTTNLDDIAPYSFQMNYIAPHYIVYCHLLPGHIIRMFDRSTKQIHRHQLCNYQPF